MVSSILRARPVPLEALPFHGSTARTITYVGPAFSGKATSIAYLADRFSGEIVHGLVDEARVLGALVRPFTGDLDTAVRLLSVAGSITYPGLSKRLLDEADSYILVVDAQRERLPVSEALLYELRARVKPIVIQANKLDLPSAVTIEEVERLLLVQDEALVGSMATKGEGVIESFNAALRNTH